MKRVTYVVVGAMVIAGCHREPAKQVRTHVDAASVRPLSLSDALAEAQRDLRKRVDDGALDALAVEAARARATALRIADGIEGLSTADLRDLRAATAALAQAADSLVAAGDRGDQMAAGQALARLEAAHRRMVPIVAHGRIAETAAAVAKPGADGSREVRLDGEFIDPQCYFTHDGHGVDHIACAKMCARGGQDLAFLDGSGRILQLIAGAHGQDPNTRVIDYAGLPVTVEGVEFTRHGNHVLFVRSIEKH